MPKKALTLALLMIVSALAGCIEGSDEKSDSTDDVIVDDRSGNASYGIVTELIGISQSVCNSNGGTWIEASERGGESYCDIDTLDIQRVVCESGNGTWIWVEIVFERSGGPVSHINSVDIDNDHELAGGHSHSHSHGDTTHTHWHEHGGICDPPSPNSEVLEELKIHCEIMGGNWTAPNSTAEQNRGNDTRPMLDGYYLCVAGEPEISADECERRGGNLTEIDSTADRGKDNETGCWQIGYCAMWCMMPGDTEVNLTEEECQREGGDWHNGCFVNRNHGSENHHHLVVVYPDNLSNVMPCRGCTGLENMTGWNLTTTVFNEWNISFNHSTSGKYSKTITAINGSNSSNDSSWHWTHYIWNETDRDNASWEESRTGIDAIMLGNHTNHIAWAPNSTHPSDIPAPRSVVNYEENRSEMTEEDCERRGGTWVEVSERESEYFCDYGEDDREEEQGDDREEEGDSVSR